MDQPQTMGLYLWVDPLTNIKNLLKSYKNVFLVNHIS